MEQVGILVLLPKGTGSPGIGRAERPSVHHRNRTGADGALRKYSAVAQDNVKQGSDPADAGRNRREPGVPLLGND